MPPVYHERPMIVRSEDVEARPPKWMDDPSVSTELRDAGMAEFLETKLQ